MHKKAESTGLEKLQKRVEELENRMKEVQDNSQGGRSWADITDSAEKRTVQEVIKKSLKDRDNEEKERQKRQRNIIIFELPESKETNTEYRKEEDIRKFIGLCRNICKVNITEESLEKAIRLSKVSDDKERPLLTTLKEENKKREIFQNLNKICEAGDPFDKITVTHDLTAKQKEELKDKIEEAREKERSDELGEFMYQVCGPPCSWFIKKISKKVNH